MYSNTKNFHLLLYGIKKSFFFIFPLLFFIYLTPNNIEGQQLDPIVYPADTNISGIPYKEWIGKWWQWNVNLPSNIYNMDGHNSEQKCEYGQMGPVWFLPDTITGKQSYNCDIPFGKSILVPIVTGAGWNDGGFTDSDIRKTATEFQDGDLHPSTTLDGNDVEVPRATTSFYNITVPSDSWNRSTCKTPEDQALCPTGTFRALADGYYVLFKPLEPGQHTIKTSYLKLDQKIGSIAPINLGGQESTYYINAESPK